MYKCIYIYIYVRAHINIYIYYVLYYIYTYIYVYICIYSVCIVSSNKIRSSRPGSHHLHGLISAGFTKNSCVPAWRLLVEDIGIQM